MLTVNQVPNTVENDLRLGRLSCPDCGGRLRAWGWARPRVIRGWSVPYRVRPRRGRCVGCAGTHVLLPAWLTSRRADCLAVIAAAIEDKFVVGTGHRSIAARLGRPASTVRGWLRAFGRHAADISRFFTDLTRAHSPDAARVWAAPASSVAAGAISAVMAYTAGLGQRFGAGTLTWARAANAACAGRLLCSSFWPAGGDSGPTRVGSWPADRPAVSVGEAPTAI